MLVLTRKVGEGIKIDENIFVRVVQLKGKQVRLGIEAPKETKIHREELGSEAPAQQKKNRENATSTQPSNSAGVSTES